jgi:hypothetical protein
MCKVAHLYCGFARCQTLGGVHVSSDMRRIRHIWSVTRMPVVGGQDETIFEGNAVHDLGL